MLRLIKALQTAKELKNIISINGYEDLRGIEDFSLLNSLLLVAQARVDSLNVLESIENEETTNNILNIALEDIIFQFVKIDESELVLADEFKNILRKTRETLLSNFDQKDLEFISLREELERLFKKKNLSEVTQQEMVENMHLLQKIYDKAKELNRKNALLKAKYENDEKYTRIHKRLTEKGTLNARESQLHRALMMVKEQVDEKLQGQEELTRNEAYFERYLLQLVVHEFKKKEKIPLDYPTTESINNLILNEYLQQYQYK